MAPGAGVAAHCSAGAKSYTQQESRKSETAKGNSTAAAATAVWYNDLLNQMRLTVPLH
jgi:hypothetical protein